LLLDSLFQGQLIYAGPVLEVQLAKGYSVRAGLSPVLLLLIAVPMNLTAPHSSSYRVLQKRKIVLHVINDNHDSAFSDYNLPQKHHLALHWVSSAWLP
jgi:hypothetical protein